MGLFRKKQSEIAEAESSISLTPNASNPHELELSGLVLRAINEGVLIVDNAGNVSLANPAACQMLGRSNDEIVGVNYESSVSLLDKTGNRISTARNPIQIALVNREFKEVRDLDLISADSKKSIPISIITTPTDANDQKSPIIVTFRDIAKELQEEHERSEFISTASHEMRTPVASIEGYLGLAMNPTTATIDERAKTYLEKAHESSQHLGRLFQDLLDTTKLDDGKIKVIMEPVNVVDLVKNIADANIPRISEKGLGYQFGSGTVDQQLSGGKVLDQLIYASVDKSFLQEIINNLIENAIKYTPEGWITVNVRADNYNVQITVSDTGIGIPREELSHIFQKFYRVDNRDTREIGGTGLGLYLVKQRVEAINGRIWAESELGKGSQFILLLPRISQEEYDKQKFYAENNKK